MSAARAAELRLDRFGFSSHRRGAWERTHDLRWADSQRVDRRNGSGIDGALALAPLPPLGEADDSKSLLNLLGPIDDEPGVPPPIRPEMKG